MTAIVPLGHRGTLLLKGSTRVAVNPMSAPFASYRPAGAAGDSLQPTDILLVTSDRAGGAHIPALRALATGQRLLASRSVYSRLAGRAWVGDVEWIELTTDGQHLDGVEVRLLRASDKDSAVAVRFADDPWVVIDSGQSIGRPVTDRDFQNAAFVLNADLANAERVQTGGPRGFPSAEYAHALNRARALVGNTRGPVIVTGGLLHVGRSSWLNSFAMPVSPQQFATDLRAMVDLDVRPAGNGRYDLSPAGQIVAGPALDSASESTIPFDPTAGVPALAPAGEKADDALAELRELWGDSAAGRAETVMAIAESWGVTLRVTVVADDGQSMLAADLTHNGPSVVNEGRAPNLRIRVTASGLRQLLRGEADTERLILADELRISSAICRQEGSMVIAPYPPGPTRPVGGVRLGIAGAGRLPDLARFADILLSHRPELLGHAHARSSPAGSDARADAHRPNGNGRI